MLEIGFMIYGLAGLSRRSIMVAKYSLVSKGYKLLSDLMILFVVCLIIIVIYYNQYTNVFVDIFIVILLIFFSYALFATHYAKINIIKNRRIVFYVFSWFKPKKYIFSFDEINELSLDQEIGDINVISLKAQGKSIRFTGYNSLKGIKTNLEKSKIIVEKINNEINI